MSFPSHALRAAPTGTPPEIRVAPRSPRSASRVRALALLGGFILLQAVLLLATGPSLAAVLPVSSTYKYAWAENAGWLNFKPSHNESGEAAYHDNGANSFLTGWVWAENIGWVKLSCTDNGPFLNTTPANWGVNADASGGLSGYGWSESVGWVSFKTDFAGVTRNAATGQLEGYAWCENAGYIHFKGANPAYAVAFAEELSVTTSSVANVTDNSAVSGGTVAAASGANVIARGVCWNMTGVPTVADPKTSDGVGVGAFTSHMTSLEFKTTYYVRAYASTSQGTTYGQAASFTTNLPPAPTMTKNDIVWRNKNTGETRVWFMEGISRTGGAYIATVPMDWALAAVADFNRDGKSDLLWSRKSDGRNVVWYMDGVNRMGRALLESVPWPWNVRGAGDFNGDGRPDLVWRNPVLGRNTIWLMNGITRVRSCRISDATSSWGVQCLGDLDNDGKPDLLWRNSTNDKFRIWFMDYNDAAGVFRRDGCAKQDVGSDWAIRGVADFTEDGMNDVLWRNKQTGANVIMFMDGINEVISHTLPAVSPTDGWDIFGVGTFHYSVDTQ